MCKQTISADDIAQAISDSPQVKVVCPTCRSENLLEPRYMQGDLCNLIHEKGWAAHTTSAKHSTAAITITMRCMSKQDRCENRNAHVYSFIPMEQLPTDSPHKFDGFLEPLVSELEDLYMYGKEVFASLKCRPFLHQMTLHCYKYLHCSVQLTYMLILRLA